MTTPPGCQCNRGGNWLTQVRRENCHYHYKSSGSGSSVYLCNYIFLFNQPTTPQLIHVRLGRHSRTSRHCDGSDTQIQLTRCVTNGGLTDLAVGNSCRKKLRVFQQFADVIAGTFTIGQTGSALVHCNHNHTRYRPLTERFKITAKVIWR